MTAIAGADRQPVPTADSSPVPRGERRRVLRQHWVPIALTLIILGGTVVRLVGVNWGLPLQLHPDEWVIVDGAIDMARRHSFEPGYYYRPDHVEMQLSNLAYLGYSYLFHGTSPGRLFATVQAPFFLISRLITECFGVGMIVLGYRIGVRFNRVIGITTAFLIAFFPPFVVNSHFATPDVPLSFALMVVIVGCMRYLVAPSWRNLLLSCAGVSVAIAVKYPGAIGAAMIGITVMVSGIQARDWRLIFKRGTAAVGAVVGFLFLISPVLFTNARVVVASFSNEAGGNHLGGDGLGWLGNMGFYVADLATSVGIILVLCFALGIVWSVRLRLSQTVPLWTGALVWPLLSHVGLHWPRWGLPMYLTPLLIAPIGIYYSASYILDHGAAGWLRGVAAALGVLMVANLLTGSVAALAQYAATTTENVGAQDFAARHIDATNTVFEGYTPLRPGGPADIFDQFEVIGGRLMLSTTERDGAGKRYVAVSSTLYDRWDSDPRYSSEQRFYQMLAHQFVLVTTYNPVPEPKPIIFDVVAIWRNFGYIAGIGGGGLSGPTIKLYEIPADRR